MARVLVGFSLGMCLCVSPMYMGEVATPRTRGLAGSTIGVMINLGILFAYGVCPYLSIRSFAAILMTIALVFEITFWFMPESPYYLAMKGNFDEAEACLEKLRGRSDVSQELEIIKEQTVPKPEDPAVEGERRKNSFWLAFEKRGNRRALAIGLIFLIPQHFGGYFLILSYCDLIFKDGVESSFIDNHLATIAVGLSQLVSSIIAGVLVDRLGRRSLILSAGIIAGLANAAIGTFLFFKEYSSSHLVDDYSVFFLVAVLVQVFFFNCGLLSTHMVVMSEVFATDVKGFGMSFVGMCSAVFGIITTKYYIKIAITWGIGHSVPFLAFAGVVWFSSVLLFFLTPETKGKTFLQIQQKLNR